MGFFVLFWFGLVFRILRGLLALQNDATMQFRKAGQRTLGDGEQYRRKPNISNYGVTWGRGSRDDKCPEIFFSI